MADPGDRTFLLAGVSVAPGDEDRRPTVGGRPLHVIVPITDHHRTTHVDADHAESRQRLRDEAQVHLRLAAARDAREQHRVEAADSLENLRAEAPFFYFNSRRVLLLDSFPNLLPPLKPVDADVIILSKNVNAGIDRLQQWFRCRQYVFDASVPAWKIRQWKNECDSLHLRRHSVQDDGAFILDL